MTLKLPADLMALCWIRLHQGGLNFGEVECHRCRLIYPLGQKHGCTALEPTT